MLRRLAYVSRPVDDLGPNEVARIIRVSRSRNPDLGVTGILVFAGNGFAQWIEGRADAVDALWETIRSDSRHRDIVLLVDERDREVRQFGEWRAGFPADAEVAAELEALRVAGRALAVGEAAAFRALLRRCDVA